MLMSILGFLALIGFGLFWIFAVIIGIRDGIIRKRIAIRVTMDRDRVLEGLQATVWGWVLVVTATFFVIALLWGLLGPYIDFV
jgi:hypothetical protein